MIHDPDTHCIVGARAQAVSRKCRCCGKPCRKTFCAPADGGRSCFLRVMVGRMTYQPRNGPAVNVHGINADGELSDAMMSYLELGINVAPWTPVIPSKERK